MAADTTIHPFPELRALAEEEARDIIDAIWAYDAGCNAVPTMDATRSAMLTLLCDLTRPASRDAVCRLIAAHQRVDVVHVHRTIHVARTVPDFMSLTDAEQLAIAVRHLWPESP